MCTSPSRVPVHTAQVFRAWFLVKRQSTPVIRTSEKACRAMLFLHPGRASGQCGQVTRVSGARWVSQGPIIIRRVIIIIIYYAVCLHSTRPHYYVIHNFIFSFWSIFVVVNLQSSTYCHGMHVFHKVLRPHVLGQQGKGLGTPRLDTSQTGQYSIDLPWRDGRLSWPRWLITYRDGLPTSRRSPIPVRDVNFVFFQKLIIIVKKSIFFDYRTWALQCIKCL